MCVSVCVPFVKELFLSSLRLRSSACASRSQPYFDSALSQPKAQTKTQTQIQSRSSFLLFAPRANVRGLENFFFFATLT